MRIIRKFDVIPGLPVIVLLLIMMLNLLTCVQKTQQKLPVYRVIKSGTSQEDAHKLSHALDIVPEEGIDLKNYVNKDGLVTFRDSKRFQYIPTRSLGSGELDEAGQETILEAFDFEAMRNIQVIGEQLARLRFEKALTESNLRFENDSVIFSHNKFKTYDLGGKMISEIHLDTRVRFIQTLESFPLTGPGAKIEATFNGNGNVTQLRYANRELKKGELVPIISQEDAAKHFAEIYRRCISGKKIKDLRLNTKLIYYSPPLNMKTVKIILPFYECGGVAVIDSQEVMLLDELIPAVNSLKYVPDIHIDADANGSTVNARVSINGGAPPYQINWSSSNTHLNQISSSISYEVSSRVPTQNEIIMVTVTDANGVFVKACKKLKVTSKVIQLNETVMQPRAGVVIDYGTENAVTNQFGDLEQGFVNAMYANGITERFSWSGVWAWEQDFRSTGDNTYIDNTDITLYIGHGNGDGFIFENNSHDDNKLDHDDATGDWGDTDLEWLALYSCQVLEDSCNGMSRIDRWSQEFDGLHLLLGFDTNAQVNNDFTGAFAQNMLGASPMTVREAWFKAIDDYQPDDRVGVVMGVMRAGDFVTNYNDYFWGKGTVGPDIRDSEIGFFWAVEGP